MSRSGLLLPQVLLALTASVCVSCGEADPTDESVVTFETLTTEYIAQWTDYYPDRAAQMGLDEFRDRTEDRSPAGIEGWVSFNDSILDLIDSAPPSLSLDIRIDLRLIRKRGRAELDRWGEVERAETDELPEAGSDGFRLGRDRYEVELRQYYDFEVTPEELAERALEEIRTVRQLMEETSSAHWNETHAGSPASEPESTPEDRGALVAWALSEMEENRPSTQQESLELFTRFANEAEAFVRDRGIATLPPERTLEIVLTPASAGPAQRIGFVNSAPPFDPTVSTVLSLPTIEDTFPVKEKDDFYRSFNNHFNKAIIVHELFPGHYMQAKIASQNPRKARIFFPYQPYIEGWATLVEKIALDAGWDDYNRLTYLAHLRKRLENANRAYTSVQVHCFGWTEEEVLGFSEEESLLAPQFAKSLWGRLQRSPMQMTSYFMGADQLTRILEAEKERLGEAFDVREFNDRILRAGPVPFDLIPVVLAGG